MKSPSSDLPVQSLQDSRDWANEPHDAHSSPTQEESVGMRNVQEEEDQVADGFDNKQCDEARPTCKNCAYRETDCVYDDSVKFITSTRAKDTLESQTAMKVANDDQSAPSEPSVPYPPLPDFFVHLPRGPSSINPPAVADSVLLAHYCQRISSTFAAAARSEADAKILGQVVPLLACQYECVSHAVAALAALDVWCEEAQRQEGMNVRLSQPIRPRTPEPLWSQDCSQRTSASYLHRARVRYGQCLRAFHKELETVGEHNIDAILACSVLLIIYGLGYSQVERKGLLGSGNTRTSRTEASECSADSTPEYSYFFYQDKEDQSFLDLSYVHLVRGVKSVNALAIQNPEWTRNSAVLPLLAYSCSQPASSITQQKIRSHSLFSTISIEGRSAMDRLEQRLMRASCTEGTDPTSSPAVTLVCCQTLQHLQSSAEEFCAARQLIHRVLLSWIGKPDAYYFEILALGNVYALAVYAHFMVYMILLEDLWWIHDLGISNLRDILRTIDERNWMRGFEHSHIDNDGETSPYEPNSELQALFAWPRSIENLYRSNNETREHYVLHDSCAPD